MKETGSRSTECLNDNNRATVYISISIIIIIKIIITNNIKIIAFNLIVISIIKPLTSPQCICIPITLSVLLYNTDSVF